MATVYSENGTFISITDLLDRALFIESQMRDDRRNEPDIDKTPSQDSCWHWQCKVSAMKLVSILKTALRLLDQFPILPDHCLTTIFC